MAHVCLHREIVSALLSVESGKNITKRSKMEGDGAVWNGLRELPRQVKNEG
jgi:hypothetical protein